MFFRSFRARLTWFFVVIVILPLIAVSIVLFDLVADSERGQRDARLALAETAARGLFQAQEERAAAAAEQFAGSPGLAAAIAAGDAARIDAELGVIARQVRASRVTLAIEGGRTRTWSGDDVPVAPATTRLVSADRARMAELRVAVQTATGLARSLRAVTGFEVLVTGPGDRTLAATLEGVDPRAVPELGDIDVGDVSYRSTRRLTAPTWEDDGRISVQLLADQRGTRAAIRRGTLKVVVLLVAFLVLACGFALSVSHGMQDQIRRLLQAARRLGGGELDVRVPTEGNDEFAALGTELNHMARQLSARLSELEAERERLSHAFRRVGESFAKNLDRDALLELVVHTAVDSVAASVGRASVREAADGPLAERARAGEQNGYTPVLDRVEALAVARHEQSVVHEGDVHALSHPLRPSDGGDRVLGLLTVARRARAFSCAEQELFNYLATQASVSIENVDLHEAVQRQAITDGLTGLFNHRRFQEVVAVEVERARRFGHALGLVMLDIDDFKDVNDRYGHLQGDLVLREVARVLADSSREIDEPARYGGEEMAVALPQTDLQGAQQFAERVRRRIEKLEVPRLDGAAGAVRVTASLGAAALPESAGADKDALVAAADSALYRAKRLGKNRVVAAG